MMSVATSKCCSCIDLRTGAVAIAVFLAVAIALAISVAIVTAGLACIAAYWVGRQAATQVTRRSG